MASEEETFFTFHGSVSLVTNEFSNEIGEIGFDLWRGAMFISYYCPLVIKGYLNKLV